MTIPNQCPENMNDFINSIKCLVIRNLRYYIPSGIRTVYFVGSFSTKEVTILHKPQSDEVCVSDVDVIVDVDLLTFLKCHITSLAQRLSEILTNRLRLKGIETHVSISIKSFSLYELLRFIAPQNTVYLYELTPIEFYQNEHATVSYINGQCIPNRLDSLNLVFSSIADYVFTKLQSLEEDTLHEKTYTIAKRCLTILYSLLLFEGVHPKTYTMRISLARRHFNKLKSVLSDEDLQILDALVDYKLKGIWSIPAEKLPTKPKTIYELQNFLDDFFKELATKVIAYELSRYIYADDVHKMPASSSNLIDLLKGYRSKAELVPHKRLIFTLQSVLSFLIEKDSEKLKLALNSILMKRLRIDDLLRYIVGRLFLSTVNGRAKLDLKNVMETKRMWFLFMVQW